MTPKEKLIALAVTFGIVTEGLTAAQLQEQLDANTGYQAFKAEESAKESAEAKTVKLEGDLAGVTEILENANAAAGLLHERIVELEGDLSAANADLGTATAKVDELQEQIDNQASGTKTAPDTDGKTYVTYNGRKYGFKADAPKKINVNGVVSTQDELLNNEDTMAFLIEGGSAFVKRIV